MNRLVAYANHLKMICDLTIRLSCPTNVRRADRVGEADPIVPYVTVTAKAVRILPSWRTQDLSISS
jgi:hypothetical protein